MTSTYRDIDLSFSRHPGTKDILIKTDVEAVKTALRNLFLYSKYEKPFDPNFGVNVRKVLFENNGPLLNSFLKRKIAEQLSEYEPRCFIDDVIVTDLGDENALYIQLNFHVIGMPEQQKILIDFERVR